MNRQVCGLLTCISLLVLIQTPGCAVTHEVGELTSTGVIFSAEQTTKTVARIPMLEISAPFWKPNAEDIAKLEGKLAPYVQEIHEPQAAHIAKNLDRYKRQYLGYTAGGKKKIFVNGFCEGPWARDTSWSTDLVFVYDGGPCFFQGYYDLTSERFERLEINGSV